ncbi:MFS transporter [Candidatus Nanosalina sp. VS9-1]|uniref:MFS transporter n=1 Tax=Candidatus Nanosalina sp. VS9-1 TaxID=3388566 RepID=UPI0039DFE0DB
MEIDRVPRIAKYLSLVFLVGWLGRSTVWNFLPIYFEQHMSVFLVGIATSIPALLTIMLDIPTGNLVQRAGEKVVIFLGLITAAFPPLFYYFAIPVMLVLGKISEGLCKAFIWNGSWSLSLKSSDDDVESETVSVFLLGVNLAVIIGPVIGGFLIASRGFSLTFGLWVFTSTLAVLIYLSYIGINTKESLVDSVEEVLHRKTYSDDWHHLKDNWKHLRLPFSLVFLYSIIFSFYWVAIPLLLDKVSGDFAVMGLIFGVAALPKAFQFIFGELADRIGQLKTIGLLSLFLTPVLVAMNFLSGTLVIGAFFFIARLLSSGMSPAIHAMFDSRVPDEVESEMVGFNELFKHSGQVIGPILAGTVSSIWSVNASFFAAGLISVIILGVTAYNLR